MIGMLRGSKSHEPQKDRKDKDHNRFHLTDAPDIALGAINGSPLSSNHWGPHNSTALSDPDP
ncbi:hypothetical protein N7471_002049 [Penicillium samsonianum]|uniref:uncharacterized protein n=1 Tax=Penicillium samsonianum TaxID=1882272 RepID=UPI0025499C1F|nr:uncharacterized protein N7471_002049 [Penicillium samsonianum]KAJ6142596.1 hypothetical protein N7471_002049 [Penicillium samsonianum]